MSPRSPAAYKAPRSMRVCGPRSWTKSAAILVSPGRSELWTQWQATRNAAAVFDGASRLLCLKELAEARIDELFDVAQGALVFYDGGSQLRFVAFLAFAVRREYAAEPKPIVQSVRNRAGRSVAIRVIGLLRGARKFPPTMRKCSFCSAILNLWART